MYFVYLLCSVNATVCRVSTGDEVKLKKGDGNYKNFDKTLVKLHFNFKSMLFY